MAGRLTPISLCLAARRKGKPPPNANHEKTWKFHLLKSTQLKNTLDSQKRINDNEFDIDIF